MKTADIRAVFLRYFEERAHKIVPSDSLIPSTDPTLLFTSAGMVPFKPYFQNPSASPFQRAASCQKCLRTSDIERVGSTLRHLTFFEMLGNFSFGDYFKEDAIAWGWEFLTGTMKLPKERFAVSVYKEDEEAFGLWKKFVPETRIVKLGEDSNFWTMGPTGPCGPCSEILWDRGEGYGKERDYQSDRYMEVWNLVFTQFDRCADGKLAPLPSKNIDTGMGLERLALLVQGVDSPFKTDGFRPLFKTMEEFCGGNLSRESLAWKPPFHAIQTAVLRVVEHSRAAAFMISDGVLPSNEGRGYVLRRLLRQAILAGKKIGILEPFLFRMTGTVVDLMKDAYPELLQRRETIASLVKTEEEKFHETLGVGIRRLEELIGQAKTKTLAGEDVFQLYDTYGFPFELTKETVEERGFRVDEEGYRKAQERAVELARQAWRGSGAQDVERYRQWKSKAGVTTVFRGYDTLEVSSKLGAPLYRLNPTAGLVDVLRHGEEGEVVFTETPFYPEGGGQVGDRGWIESASSKAEVFDTQSPLEGFIVHRVRVTQGHLTGGDMATLRVDRAKREATMRHHTATHLLHKALREVLGPHVTQAGSLVAPDRLRFDFNQNAPLTREERERVEDIVNRQILNDIPVRACPMTKDQAHKVGAMMLFGEKYGEQVRAVMVSPHDCGRAQDAWSLELCGGTHVHATGQIGIFKIIGQSAVSAGVRRIEAIAGLAALEVIRRTEYQLALAAETLKTSPDDLATRLEKVLTQERQLQKEIEALKSGALRSQFDDIARSVKSVGGIPVISRQVGSVEDRQLREVADRLRDGAGVGVVLLASVQDGKISFVVSVQKPLTERGLHAGHLAKEFATLIQGSGGGRPDFAQGGGKNVDALDAALAQVEEILKKMVVKAPHH